MSFFKAKKGSVASKEGTRHRREVILPSFDLHWFGKKNKGYMVTAMHYNVTEG